jgi:hypothetical protein
VCVGLIGNFHGFMIGVYDPSVTNPNFDFHQLLEVSNSLQILHLILCSVLVLFPAENMCNTLS